MTERFAIYYAPDRDSTLWRRGCDWLGRDAAAKTFLRQPEFKKIGTDEFADATALPRRYGLHATIRPPMRLAAGVDLERLQAVARALSARLPIVEIGKFEVKLFRGFLALVPEKQKSAVTSLAADCVSYFEPMRAPLEVEEQVARMGAGLTDAQMLLLDKYGYPYVMDEYRMHISLTGPLEESQRKVFKAAAERWFEKALEEDYVLNSISIFHEPGAGEPFERIADFPLYGDA